jgi:hypothetical protein
MLNKVLNNLVPQEPILTLDLYRIDVFEEHQVLDLSEEKDPDSDRLRQHRVLVIPKV